MGGLRAPTLMWLSTPVHSLTSALGSQLERWRKFGTKFELGAPAGDCCQPVRPPPRGGVERGETVTSEKMAETMGFEPMIPFWGMLI